MQRIFIISVGVKELKGCGGEGILISDRKKDIKGTTDQCSSDKNYLEPL